jgi:transcription initiation factor TFIIIB Brf1 subunit/transcription initiation factor TFIIB
MIMENTKMTNAKALDYVLENVELPEEVREKIQNIYNSTIKKSTNRKPSKTSQENKAYAELVYQILVDEEPMTISEIMKSSDTLSQLSNQKVTAVVRMMIADGTVTKIVDGKKSTFTLTNIPTKE